MAPMAEAEGAAEVCPVLDRRIPGCPRMVPAEEPDRPRKPSPMTRQGPARLGPGDATTAWAAGPVLFRGDSLQA
jgi:hypothetical protein